VQADAKAKVTNVSNSGSQILTGGFTATEDNGIEQPLAGTQEGEHIQPTQFPLGAAVN
jgi:hypothetical protein